LEPSIRQAIIRELTDKRQQWTLVLVSNEKEVAMSCERVILFRHGNILQDDIPQVIIDHPDTDDIWFNT
jgi:ABC-type Fe3+/spermidine/putrescine transport system ATPase subunit